MSEKLNLSVKKYARHFIIKIFLNLGRIELVAESDSLPGFLYTHLQTILSYWNFEAY